MRRSPRQYDIEFKRRAVQMILDGRPRMEVARDLDVPESCLRRWKKGLPGELDKQTALGEPRASELAAENARLRRELNAMTEQRDILKKTIRIFDEMDSRNGRR